MTTCPTETYRPLREATHEYFARALTLPGISQTTKGSSPRCFSSSPDRHSPFITGHARDSLALTMNSAALVTLITHRSATGAGSLRCQIDPTP